jgi:hypothetical protein
MERDRGWIYRRCKRRGTTANPPKKSWYKKSLEQKVILKRRVLLKNCPGELL